MIIILRARFQVAGRVVRDFLGDVETQSVAKFVAPDLDPVVPMEWGVDFDSLVPGGLVTLVGCHPVHHLTSSQVADLVRYKNRDGRAAPPKVIANWYMAPRLRYDEDTGKYVEVAHEMMRGLLTVLTRQSFSVVVPGDWSGKEAIFLLRPI